MYGVEIHANVVESVLRSEFLTHESRMTEIVLLVGLVMATFFITSGIRTSIAHRNALLEVDSPPECLRKALLHSICLFRRRRPGPGIQKEGHRIAPIP